VTSVKALVFDVFGTVVDWRTSVAREVEALAKRKGLTIDGTRFADAWRAGYAPSMNRVRTGELPWTKLDRLHRMTLDRLLVDFKLTLSEAETDALNRAWHRLQPWSDSVPGLTRLKKRFTIAPLSNGNVSLMTDMAKHAGLPWDCVLGAELVRHYKPDHEVYQSAAGPGWKARSDGRRLGGSHGEGLQRSGASARGLKSRLDCRSSTLPTRRWSTDGTRALRIDSPPMVR
jgi:2-haloacid dehalogenase